MGAVPHHRDRRAPHARGFFEALVTDNLGLGRPDTIEIIFDRRARSGTASEFKTKIVSPGTEVTINAFYKHSRIKQYLKDQRALRIETVVNASGDLGCQRRLVNLGDLQARARAVMPGCCRLNVPAGLRPCESSL